MFGKMVKNGIAFTINKPGFTVFRKKYLHNYKVPIKVDNYEGAHGCDLNLMKAVAVGLGTKI